MLFCRLLIVFQNQFFEKFFQSVKQFGSRSGAIYTLSDVGPSYQQMTLVGKEWAPY